MKKIHLKKLSTSLTKHNVHKLSSLIKKYNSEDILNHLDEIKVDRPVTIATLSAYDKKNAPELWDKAGKQSIEFINGLLMIAIIFSHHRVLEIFTKASNGEGSFSGKIVRGTHFSQTKEYTNTVRVIRQLGFSIEKKIEFLRYDVSPIFKNEQLGKLASDLIALKLKKAGWNGNNKLVDEVNDLSLNKVLSLTPYQMEEWLSGYSLYDACEAQRGDDDIKDVVFQSGHRKSKKGLTKRKSVESSTINYAS